MHYSCYTYVSATYLNCFSAEGNCFLWYENIRVKTERLFCWLFCAPPEGMKLWGKDF